MHASASLPDDKYARSVPIDVPLTPVSPSATIERPGLSRTSRLAVGAAIAAAMHRSRKRTQLHKQER